MSAFWDSSARIIKVIYFDRENPLLSASWWPRWGGILIGNINCRRTIFTYLLIPFLLVCLCLFFSLSSFLSPFLIFSPQPSFVIDTGLWMWLNLVATSFFFFKLSKRFTLITSSHKIKTTNYLFIYSIYFKKVYLIESYMVNTESLKYQFFSI